MRNLIGKIFGKYLVSRRYLLKTRSIIYSYNGPEPRRIIYDKVLKIAEEGKTLLRNEELYNIFSLVKRLGKVKGDIAEVGVHMGGSAKLILEAEQNKAVWLFDTFEGLPETSDRDQETHYKGRFNCGYEEVANYLEGYKNHRLIKGFFPQTGGIIKDKKFSFVHFDVDLYQSTKDCLGFFYPRMTSGGVILLHDYIKSKGVRDAIDEFFADKPEAIFETFGSQCLIVKL